MSGSRLHHHSGEGPNSDGLRKWKRPGGTHMTCRGDYVSVHKWLNRHLGPASAFRCSRRRCPRRAREWALDHELRGMLFTTVSLDTSAYRPLCPSHHRKLDKWVTRQRHVVEVIGEIEVLAPELLDDALRLGQWALTSLTHRPRGT